MTNPGPTGRSPMPDQVPVTFDAAHISASFASAANSALIECGCWRAQALAPPEFRAAVGPDGELIEAEILRKNYHRRIAFAADRALGLLAGLQRDLYLDGRATWPAFAVAHAGVAPVIDRLKACAEAGRLATLGMRRRPREEGPPYVVAEDNASWEWLEAMEATVSELTDHPVRLPSQTDYLDLIVEETDRRLRRSGRSGVVEFGGKDVPWQIFRSRSQGGVGEIKPLSSSAGRSA